MVDRYRPVVRRGAARRLQTLRHRLLVPKPFEPLTATRGKSDENTHRWRGEKRNNTQKVQDTGPEVNPISKMCLEKNNTNGTVRSHLCSPRRRRRQGDVKHRSQSIRTTPPHKHQHHQTQLGLFVGSTDGVRAHSFQNRHPSKHLQPSSTDSSTLTAPAPLPWTPFRNLQGSTNTKTNVP